MPLSTTHRWVQQGTIEVLTPKNIQELEGAPSFTLEEIIDAFRVSINNKFTMAFGKDKSKEIWSTDLSENDESYYFVLHVGDENEADSAVFNRKTGKTREDQKGDDDMSHYSSHVLIKKDNTKGKHVIVLEIAPSITLSRLEAFLTRVFSNPEHQKTYKNSKNQEKLCRPNVIIKGYPSDTIGEMLKTGKLQGFEFVKEKEVEDRWDETPLLEIQKTSNLFKVSKHAKFENLADLLKFGQEKWREFSGNKETSQMFLRIKTDQGQSKMTHIDSQTIDSAEFTNDVLEQAFIKNEKIEGFSVKLSQWYSTVRPDVLEKMSKIANSLPELK